MLEDENKSVFNPTTITMEDGHAVSVCGSVNESGPNFPSRMSACESFSLASLAELATSVVRPWPKHPIPHAVHLRSPLCLSPPETRDLPEKMRFTSSLSRGSPCPFLASCILSIWPYPAGMTSPAPMILAHSATASQAAKGKHARHESPLRGELLSIFFAPACPFFACRCWRHLVLRTVSRRSMRVVRTDHPNHALHSLPGFALGSSRLRS